MGDGPKIACRRTSRDDVKKARALRNQASFVERKLWRCLSVQCRTAPLHFRRQHPIRPYVVDFICLAAQIIVEVDGPSHEGARAYDEQREAFLRKAGFEVIHFSNDAVCENVEGVVVRIIEVAQKRLRTLPPKKGNPHPNPPLKGEGTSLVPAIE